MRWQPASPKAQAGDLVQLVGPRNKIFFIELQTDQDLHTNYGVLHHDDLIGATWGTEIFSHAGNRFLLLQPRFSDLLLKIRRTTQILFPKDIGMILLMLSIGPGSRVVEAGTGSGALTTAFARSVGKDGRVYTYEVRAEIQALARQNLERLDLSSPVTFWLQDIREGFHETGADAVFLDLPGPEDYLSHVRAALKPGGFFGCIVPTANQVSVLIEALEAIEFDCIEVCETLIRYYKPIPQRLRPKDRMVAHTGYLIFARRIEAPSPANHSG